MDGASDANKWRQRTNGPLINEWLGYKFANARPLAFLAQVPQLSVTDAAVVIVSAAPLLLNIYWPLLHSTANISIL